VVGDRRIDIPSYHVSQGEVIGVHPKSKHRERITADLQGAGQIPLPSFLDRDDAQLKGTVKSKPESSDCPLQINEALVVELYALRL
jgi:small subunit ribosomal protein S4